MIVSRTLIVALLASGLAAPVFAAGGGSDEKPKTVTCTKGKVLNEKTGKCVSPQDSSLTDEDRYKAVRSLAHAGNNAEAQDILASFDNPNSDRALTYWGFTTRRLGDVKSGLTYYDKALTQNPNNILARSYLGQAHVESGRLDLARSQLKEIRVRGGEGSWAEASLAEAIRTGTTFNY